MDSIARHLTHRRRASNWLKIKRDSVADLAICRRDRDLVSPTRMVKFGCIALAASLIGFGLMWLGVDLGLIGLTKAATVLFLAPMIGFMAYALTALAAITTPWAPPTTLPIPHRLRVPKSVIHTAVIVGLDRPPRTLPLSGH